ncbi:MAG: SulP family inorganic anion transporter [Salana multivorans]|uniref:SulP family inorganic anion transporter n=1 Tax=Salana multivorans TaxID=120377 RepID=UPI000A85AA66|nr:SulP family inorganic anion transporter [Salana multivorans]MBN8881206.1 SulP family inorganic anion transporter [Salana multivorans]
MSAPTATRPASPTTPARARRVTRHLAGLLPGPADLRPVRRHWRGDLLAGVTVGVVALPLALAFGISSGLDASAGIVTAIVAGLVAAVFGGSNVQVSGPTGAMAVILAPIVASHGAGAVVVISIMAGLVLVAAGLLRLGRVVVYIPWPVIEGFTAGIAIIIALQQVPLALDGHADHGARPLAAAVDVARGADWSRAWQPLAVTVAVVALVEALRRWLPRVPGALVAVVLATAVAQLAGLDIARIGALPSTLPAPQLPAVDLGALQPLVGPALAVAALAAIESLLSARVAAGMDPRTGRVLPDREVVGQGLASIASGLFGGMPATGAIARTAVNVRAGARSRLASVTHAVLLAAVIAVGAGLAGAIPLSALAGVLISTTLHMVRPSEVRALLRVSRSAAATFVVTIACTVFLDLITAVEVGVALAAFFALRTLSRTTSVRREQLPGPARPGDEQIALLTVSGSLFFGAADRIMDDIADSRAVVVVLRLSALGLMDPTGARRLGEVVTQLEARGVTVLIKGLRPEHVVVADRSGMIGSLRYAAHRFDTLEDAVAHAREHVSGAHADAEG